jgi:hypothetical protein
LDLLSARERARLAAASVRMRFDFDALPDEVAGAVMRVMGPHEVAATTCASTRFRRVLSHTGPHTTASAW